MNSLNQYVVEMYVSDDASLVSVMLSANSNKFIEVYDVIT